MANENSFQANRPVVTIESLEENQLNLISVTFPIGHQPARAVIEFLPGAPGTSDSVVPFTVDDFGAVVQLLSDSGAPVTITDASQRFMGFMTDVTWDNQSGAIEIIAEDARGLFAKMPLHGRIAELVIGSETTDKTWISAMTTTFNEGGIANMAFTDSSDRFFLHEEFGLRGLDEDGLSIVPEEGTADFWTPFSILTYLRQAYDSGFGTDLPDGDTTPANILGHWNDLIQWGVLIDGDLDVSVETGEKIVITDLALTGVSLAECISQVLNRVGRFTWFLDHSGDLPELVIIDPNKSGDISIPTLTTGTIDQFEQAHEIRLTQTNRGVFDEVYAMGARKLFEVSFQTEGGEDESGGVIPGSLVIGWDDGESIENAWVQRHLGLADTVGGTPADRKEARQRKYEWVHRRWLLSSSIDWDGWFRDPDIDPAHEARWYRHSRRFSALLAVADVKDLRDLVAEPIRRRFLLERFAEGQWQKADENWSIIPLEDVGGFIIADAARDSRFKPQGTESLPSLAWSWNAEGLKDGSTFAGLSFPMRITVTIEADERLSATRGELGTVNQRLLVNAGDTYQQQRRSSAVIPEPDDGDEPPEFKPGITPGPRDDSDRIDTMAQERLNKVQWKGTVGTVVINQIIWDWATRLGVNVDKLGTDALPGDKPIISLVSYNFINQSTTLTLER